MTCADCAAQLEDESWLVPAGVAAPPPPSRHGAEEVAALAAVRSLIARDRGVLGWLRALSTRTRITIACLAVIPATALTYHGSGLSDLALHAVLFFAACAGLLWPLQKRVPLHGRGALAALAMALPFAFALVTYATHTPTLVERAALPCLGFGFALSLPFWATLHALDRRGGMSRERALLSGAAAGLVGNALMHLHCASTGLVHLMTSHALLGALMGAVAWALMLAGSKRPSVSQ